jgi:hypothetical protein
MVLVHGGLLGRSAVLAGCLVSGPDEPSGAGIAAGFTVAGGAGHDHTRWRTRQPRIPGRLPIRGGDPARRSVPPKVVRCAYGTLTIRLNGERGAGLNTEGAGE